LLHYVNCHKVTIGILIIARLAGSKVMLRPLLFHYRQTQNKGDLISQPTVMLGSECPSIPVRPDVSSRCAMDWPNDPIKSPRLFLIKKLTARCSYPLTCRLRGAALGHQTVGRPCLPGATLSHRTVGPTCQARHAAAFEPRLASASLPTSPG
jgi:hypothetical protein